MADDGHAAVSGNGAGTQAMTLRLPKELYERLRREAYEKHVSQASIVIGALSEHYEQLENAKKAYQGGHGIPGPCPP